MEPRFGARVLDDEGFRRLVGADGLVLRAVKLKDAPDLGQRRMTEVAETMAA